MEPKLRGQGKYTGGVLIAVLLWGMSYIWKKDILELGFITPLLLVTFRVLIATATLVLIASIRGILQRLTRRDVYLFFALACVDPVGYFLLEANGLQYVTATLTSAIIATIPLFTPFMAYAINGERVSLPVWIGLLLSVGGVMLIVFSDGTENMSGQLIGILLLFGAVLTSIIYTVAVQRLTRRYNSYSIVAWQNIFSSIILIPLVFIFESHKLPQIELEWGWISRLLILGIFCSAIAFVFYADGLRKLGVTRTSTFVNLMPGVTAIASYFFLDEPLGLMKVSGIIIIMIGLYVGGYGKKEQTSF